MYSGGAGAHCHDMALVWGDMLCTPASITTDHIVKLWHDRANILYGASVSIVHGNMPVVLSKRGLC
jgi:hypothetical protein